MSTAAVKRQDRSQIDHFVRQPKSGQWLLTRFDDLKASIALTAIECNLPLAEVYADVALQPDAE